MFVVSLHLTNIFQRKHHNRLHSSITWRQDSVLVFFHPVLHHIIRASVSYDNFHTLIIQSKFAVAEIWSNIFQQTCPRVAVQWSRCQCGTNTVPMVLLVWSSSLYSLEHLFLTILSVPAVSWVSCSSDMLSWGNYKCCSARCSY
jgi:hypothetical protein